MNTFGRILKQRDFWPLFGSQALGAFNDNFFRSALIAFVAFGVSSGDSEKTILSALATGLMMLPFFLFSSLAGELADRMSKSNLIKIAKVSELLIMVVTAIFFIAGDVYSLLALLFLMGTQSAFFGPVKYGLLPEVLEENDLVGGNGLIEAATFLAIVLGTLAGSWLVTRPLGTNLYMPLGLVSVAAIGLFFALKQPNSIAAVPDLKVNPRIWESTFQIVGSIRGRRDMWLTVLAISWFWAMGGILITQIPVLCGGTVMGATPGVNTFLVTMFALGVGVGSIGVQGLLKGRVSVRLVPISAAALSVFMLLLALCVWTLPAASFGSGPVDIDVFLNNWVYLRLGICCLLVSIAGGIFVVPLNAYLQHKAEAHERSRVIAANNIINALFICIGSIIVMVMTKMGFGLHHVFLFVAVTAVIVTLMTLYFLPDEAIRVLARIVLKIIYQPKVKGLENVDALSNGPALVVANHTSFIDVALLVAYIPRRLTFAIDTYWAKTWWLKPLLRVFKALPVNPNQPLATRSLIDSLNQGELVVIFPEGRITTTGSMMKVYEGPGLIALKSKAPLLPIVFDGPQYTRFGRLRQTMRNIPRANVKMSVMAPRALEVKSVPGEKQKDHRRRAGDALFELMHQCLFDSKDYNRNLWEALNFAARRNRAGREILEDAARRPITYRGLLMRARLIGRWLSAFTAPGEKVGLMLPNSSIAVCCLYGFWAAGRTAVMLNFTQGPGPLASALVTAEVKTIVTSRRFLEAMGLGAMVSGLSAKLVFVEDMDFKLGDKIAALFWKPTPAHCESPAALVFTSGSEGKPKGVALSHRNFMANVQQCACHFQINEDDILFTPLPMFHAFGLCVGVLLPVLSGLKLFIYTTPLHPTIIPELIYDTRATMVIGTDTFAAAWGKNAHPYDFDSVHTLLLGAEKVKAKTRELYNEKEGIRIIEGYGVSEASPVLSANTRINCRNGTIGRILPGVEYRIDPVEGVAKGGRLVVRGPNIMMGYLWPENPGVIVPPQDGWYDTGDIVEIDEDDYIWIKGRFKRFAKIGGEMVSLAAIEEVAASIWPGRPQVVLAMDDESKGEKLVFITEEQKVDLPALWQALKEAGLPELTYPRQFIHLPEIPVTPLGKVNMPKVIEAAKAAAETAGISSSL